MRGRGFTAPMNGPSRIEGNVVEDRRDGRRQAKGLIRRLVNERAIEPHHGFVVIPDLGAVMVVRVDVMKSNVAMNHRRMIAMRFMRMRGRNARRERQEWRHHGTRDDAFEPPQPAVIMYQPEIRFAVRLRRKCGEPTTGRCCLVAPRWTVRAPEQHRLDCGSTRLLDPHQSIHAKSGLRVRHLAVIYIRLRVTRALGCCRVPASVRRLRRVCPRVPGNMHRAGR